MLFSGLKGEKKKEGVKKESKKEVKVEPEPEPEDMISSVKSRRLMAMQAKKEKEEMDRQNKGNPCRREWTSSDCTFYFHMYHCGMHQFWFVFLACSFSLLGCLVICVIQNKSR